jgi:hypothetical protein
VVVALVGALSALLGAGVTAYVNYRAENGKSLTELQIKQMEVQGNLNLEKQKEVEAERLARQEFETRLIMQAVQGAGPEVATRNLQFFLKAGFISDPGGKISRLSTEAPPMIPAAGTNISGLPMKNSHACSNFVAQDFKGAAKPITDQDVQEVAVTLGVDVPTLRAVMLVEAGPPYTDGRPTMLFERHVFSRLTKNKYDLSHPDISNPVPGGYGPSGKFQYDRLKEAMALDCGAALGATSWGLSSLTGLTYADAGFGNMDEMIGELMESGRAQLDIFARLIKAKGLQADLQHQDWADFARRYNGPNYAMNNYDKRLAEAYAQFRGEK